MPDRRSGKGSTKAQASAPQSGAAPGGAGRISPARSAAFEILHRVATSAAHGDDLLHGPRLADLSQPDRDLATALVLGTLRWLIALDARIRPLLSRPDADLPEPVAMALRLGALQLLYMDRIPAHAALNESVELVRAAGHPYAAGMVNAVLRRLTRTPAFRKPLVESTAAMAERLGHPRWLVERWAKRYGRAAAEAVCIFDQNEPPCADLFAGEADAPELPVMDAGSRLVAEMAAATEASPRRVWDCCAAPGGKTMVLAARCAGAELLATDHSARRAEILRWRLAQNAAGSNTTVAEADAARLPASFGTFDLILCDVPCSGTGTLSRNPEVRHRLRADDLPRQADRQRRILDGALGRLNPGGTLVYSTCSLEPEECEEVVGRALATREDRITLLPASEVLQRLQAIGRLRAGEVGRWIDGPYLRTLPGYGFRGDGFFAAVLSRR